MNFQSPYITIVLALSCAYIWTLLLTAIPVAVDLPPSNYYNGHDSWYTGSDIMRFIEPVGGLPINFWVLLESGIFQSARTHMNTSIIFLFMIAAAIYQQG